MKNILITGTSSGIGFATAVLLARNRHTVYATMRNPSKNTTLNYLAKSENLPITILPLDVTKDESVKKAVSQVMEMAGQIDVLINNAGIAKMGPVEELSVDRFIQDMDTNFIGVVRCTKSVLPGMRQNKKGCIINISSVSGRLYNYFAASYSASKAAVEAFSESLAMELAPFNVRVAVVEPGVTDTPIQTKSKADYLSVNYPNQKRNAAFFAASVENHVPPEGVAKVIDDIISGRSIKFRNPAGPDSVPALGMRASLTDEDWIASGNMDQETWIHIMEGMHLQVRKFL